MNSFFFSSDLPRRSPTRRALAWCTAFSSLALLAACEPSADASAGSEELGHRARKAQLESTSGVRVRVAGQARCRGCSIEDLQSLLGARPRQALPKDPLRLPEPLRQDNDIRSLQEDFRWSVKFRDDLQVRLSPTALPGIDRHHQTPLPPRVYSRKGNTLESVHALSERYRARFVPELDLPEVEIDALRERALRRTLRAQPDLAGLYWVEAHFGSREEMLRFGQELQALPEVEFVELEALNVPPPEDIPPKSDDLSKMQGHLGADPGVNATYAWEQGFFGEGVRVTDCEYSWQVKHEDLVDNPIAVWPGKTLGTHEINHGTAVIGIVVAGHNGYGVKGLAPKAKPAVYPEGMNNQRVQAITAAAKDSKEGDIVMLEMQTYGSQQKLVPAEYEKGVWMATKTGTDAGVLIIGAAGNGNENLDRSAYKSYMDRGDSGALIIGAGTSNKRHSRMSFSTYGKRVDVQGWGEKVVTTGYGDLKKFGGDKLQMYTRTFAGTSSATPIVSGAAALIQSFAKKDHGKVLGPIEMRELLKSTGIAQQGSGNIGPLPNVKAAMEKIGKGKPDDNEAPVVEITKPAQNLRVELEEDEDSHRFKVEVDATDDSRVQSVFLEIDGKKVGDSDESEPYLFEVELDEGEHVIVAVAKDLAENEGRSDELEAEILPYDASNNSESAGPSDKDTENTPTESDSSDETESDSSDPGESPEPGDDDSQANQSPTPSDNGGDNESNGGCAMTSATGQGGLLGLMLLGLAAWRRRKRD